MAVKDGLGVRVAAAPGVRIVRVDRLVVGEAGDRLRGQLLEHAAPAREATAKLRGRIRLARLVLEAPAFERAPGGTVPPGVGGGAVVMVGHGRRGGGRAESVVHPVLLCELVVGARRPAP